MSERHPPFSRPGETEAFDKAAEFFEEVRKPATPILDDTGLDELLMRLDTKCGPMTMRGGMALTAHGAALADLRDMAPDLARKCLALSADNARKDEMVEALNDAAVEAQMRAHKWMEAHDKLKAGKPYDLPKPADLPDALADNARMREALVEARRYIHETITTRSRREVMLAKIDQALRSREG